MEKCGFVDTGRENICSHLYHGDDRLVHIMRLDYACQVYHGKDVEDVYQEYVEGTRTFDEIAKEYRRTY